MATEVHLRNYAARQTRLAADYTTSLQDTYATYCNDLARLAADAQSRARLLWEGYLQELRAAASGDDAFERSGTAYQKLLRDSARLRGEAMGARQERNERLAEAVEALQTEVQTRALDDAIEYWVAVRRTLPPRPTKAGPSKTDGPTSS